MLVFIVVLMTIMTVIRISQIVVRTVNFLLQGVIITDTLDQAGRLVVSGAAEQWAICTIPAVLNSPKQALFVYFGPQGKYDLLTCFKAPQYHNRSIFLR